MSVQTLRLFLGIQFLLVLHGCQQLPDYHVRPKPVISANRTMTPVKPVSAVPVVPAASPPSASPASVPASPLILKPASQPQPPARRLADGRDMPAVQGLLASADSQLGLGELEEAANSLERAQRLAPQSSSVYLRLAEVRLRQGRAVEAEQFARKGLAFAQGSARQAALWYVVAAALERQGKADASRQARQKAESLEAGGDRS